MSYRLWRLEFLDTEKIYAHRSDLFGDKIVGCVSCEIRVLSTDGSIAPIFTAASVDNYNIVLYNFVFKFSPKILGCDSATDRLLRQVSHISFSYQLVW